ncbi:MAG: tRNA (adenosine(37)-N6)-threonylcarbamoyltransferase complex dimerization subunit type 1 TsaB [Bacteroidia bacterium]|jgi:tRNA threonylcarbamoyladenosine biosynthesis protein TsaB
MVKILCIETSTEICSVALAEHGKTVALNELQEGNRHASHLTTLISEVLNGNLKAIDAVAVSMGPGSYTGLRVGVSTAKGLCFALNIPLIAIPTLESLAHYFHCRHGNPDSSANLIPMIDARRMEVYTASFDSQLNQILPTSAMIINTESFEAQLVQPTYFFGNGAAKCKTVITASNAMFVDDIHCSADGMSALAQKAFDANRFEDVAYFEPFYLKDFVGTKAKR